MSNDLTNRGICGNKGYINTLVIFNSEAPTYDFFEYIDFRSGVSGGNNRVMIMTCMFATMIRDQHLEVNNYPIAGDGIALIVNKAIFFFSGWDREDPNEMLWYTTKWGSYWKPWRHIISTLPE